MPKLYESEEVKLSESKEVGLWHDRINIAKKSQEQWAQDSGANRFVKEYKGNYGIVFETRRGQVPVPPINEVFAYTQSDIATTYNRDPYITVNAEAGTVKGAALWEVILNYYWRFLKTKEEIEYEIIDKDLVGFGWHKVGYAVDSVGSGDKLKIENEKLYSNFISWKDVLWNIGSKRPPLDCQWMAQRIIKPLKEVKKKFPKTTKLLEGTPAPEVDEESYKKSSYKDDIKVCVLWEIWDREKMQIYLIAENLKDKYLEPPKPWPEYLKEFPFLMYWDFAVPGSSRPMSAIAPWEPQLLCEMVITGSAVNHVKRWNRQAFIKGGTIDENTLDKYERGDDGAVLTYHGDTADIKFADFGQLPTDFYLMLDRLQTTRRNISGQPEFVRGGSTKTNTRTVGELQLMQLGNRSGQDRKVDRLETHLENIARHMMFHLKANFDFENVVKITGEVPQEIIEALDQNFDPETGRVMFTVEEIEGEYDVDVKAGSTLPLDKQNRTQMLETILSTVAQVTSQGPMSPFLNALIQEILKDYDIKSLEEAYKQEVEQAQQMSAQQQGQQGIEDQKTQAEAQKREAQARQVEADTEITMQDAAMGPVGRAQVKSLEKPPQIHKNGKQ